MTTDHDSLLHALEFSDEEWDDIIRLEPIDLLEEGTQLDLTEIDRWTPNLVLPGQPFTGMEWRIVAETARLKAYSIEQGDWEVVSEPISGSLMGDNSKQLDEWSEQLHTIALTIENHFRRHSARKEA